jgi:hypothetical protein
MVIDWRELGTLSHISGGYDIRTDPLWVLVITAKQGHEGGIEDMAIKMRSGQTYLSAEIQALALRPDRPRNP